MIILPILTDDLYIVFFERLGECTLLLGNERVKAAAEIEPTEPACLLWHLLQGRYPEFLQQMCMSQKNQKRCSVVH